ncbi:2-C-methyl-D-erythritol 4-phosphate cytidylyltransferase [Paenibacillus naphthalenovorans]|uniref:2-C-methyl-D-erythritol 4-phosphate cytidylyltransferase n=1 Tax=Paenibacillus naphthalenovorans TaxID=162209 RepID=A0A0U2WBI0_9BACL|nr:2-C-methyl-D-erythritol 4-phosphate cytidylyltransferase [Paenibacillus naphthalenovorans]SDJ48671.1 2-C-methyl-D-erythritol 4-phosphate cytidylyltransferase [Paenibacillus naphthalenovorans]
MLWQVDKLTIRLGVVVVAAGKGSRMGTKESKQYLLIDHKPILVHTLELFERFAPVSSVALVTGADDVPRCGQFVREYGLGKVKHIIQGGKERQDSVYQGLQALKGTVDWVMVHDGVRPFTAVEHLTACLHQAMKTEAAVLAVPVKDTIKVVDGSGVIQSTPDRSSLWAIQTPQAFRFSVLLEAHERARQEGFTGTDDAMLVERMGIRVSVVEADYYNIKITTPEDLPWAEWIIRNVRGEKK